LSASEHQCRGYVERVERQTQRDKRDALIRVYDDAGNVIDTHEHKGDFREFGVGRRF
jgi:hypothetical protein